MAAPAMASATDGFGLGVTLQRPESAAAVQGFGLGFAGYTPRILEVLAAAEHDDSLVVQACAAVLWMFSESPAGPPKARAHLARARAAALPGTPRELAFATAVQRWVGGDLAGALALHAEHARAHPLDLVMVKLGQYHAFNLGDAPLMLKLALPALAAAPHWAVVQGLAAFGWEQCHHLQQAEAAARRALAITPAEPWALHALAHVLLTQGRLDEGVVALRRASKGWGGLTSFMRGHLWWHLALKLIELDDGAGALALYDTQVWGIDTSYSQDQVGAVSLLARLELAGLDVGPRWQALAGHLTGRVSDQIQPFLDLQYLYGLARGGRPEADALLARIEAHAATVQGPAQAAWQQVAVPAARGLLAHARGQWAQAAQQLAQAMPQLVLIGGSHAQRDLFEQLWIDALRRAGQLAAVQNLLRPRASALPASRRLARQAAAVEAALGLPA